MSFRRRMQRAHRTGDKPTPKNREQIRLTNPVSHNFPAFILGNLQRCRGVVEAGSAVGRSLAICGAGPSLADHIDEWRDKVDDCWGCNSAVVWLEENGYRPTHAFSVDQTAQMVREWFDAPDVEYLIASSVHPHLVEYLQSKGRRTRFFHNYVGIRRDNVEVPMEWEVASARAGSERLKTIIMTYEDFLYAQWPKTVRTGSGLNATTRAIDLAKWMGYESIFVLGADCAMRVTRPCPPGPQDSPAYRQWLKEATIMHANGGNALASGATPTTMAGEIDGRIWYTKPDLVITAAWLLRMSELLPGVYLIGDTLPNALRGKSDEFMARFPTMIDSEGNRINFEVALQEGYEILN